jgi:hypothetical protein
MPEGTLGAEKKCNDKITVVSALRNIPDGAIIRSEYLATKEMDKEIVPTHAVHSIASAVGKSSRGIGKGQLVVESLRYGKSTKRMVTASTGEKSVIEEYGAPALEVYGVNAGKTMDQVKEIQQRFEAKYFGRVNGVKGLQGVGLSKADGILCIVTLVLYGHDKETSILPNEFEGVSVVSEHITKVVPQ